MSKIKVNEIVNRNGSSITIGDANTSTVAINSGTTLTGFSSTGIDDNATSTALTIASDGRNTVDSTNEKPLVIHHSDGSNCRLGFQNNASNAHYIGVDDSDIVFSPAGLSSRIKIADMGIRAGNLDETLGLGSSTRGIACSGNGYASLRVRRGSDDGTCVQFYGHSSSSTAVGTITVTGSGTAYNTSSDYRLKENVVAMTDATTRVKQLQPKRFNFTVDADTTVDGFLAHEVSSIVPEAITGTHNEVDEEGNPVYQGIDQSKLVPLLTASLKEAIAKIEELETRIATLENA